MSSHQKPNPMLPKNPNPMLPKNPMLIEAPILSEDPPSPEELSLEEPLLPEEARLAIEETIIGSVADLGGYRPELMRQLVGEACEAYGMTREGFGWRTRKAFIDRWQEALAMHKIKEVIKQRTQVQYQAPPPSEDQGKFQRKYSFHRPAVEDTLITRPIWHGQMGPIERLARVIDGLSTAERTELLVKLMGDIVVVEDCWFKAGTTEDKHLAFVYAGETHPRHRWTAVAYGGAYEEGFVLHHWCQRKACQNPMHLEAMSHADHMMVHAKIEKGPYVQRRAAVKARWPKIVKEILAKS